MAVEGLDKLFLGAPIDVQVEVQACAPALPPFFEYIVTTAGIFSILPKPVFAWVEIRAHLPLLIGRRIVTSDGACLASPAHLPVQAGAGTTLLNGTPRVKNVHLKRRTEESGKTVSKNAVEKRRPTSLHVGTQKRTQAGRMSDVETKGLAQRAAWAGVIAADMGIAASVRPTRWCSVIESFGIGAYHRSADRVYTGAQLSWMSSSVMVSRSCISRSCINTISDGVTKLTYNAGSSAHILIGISAWAMSATWSSHFDPFGAQMAPRAWRSRLRLPLSCRIPSM
ncbi:hypothetical protein B0H10DRAFT_1957646 [Mycena sp. CBHHK59/15]|nr:hypothetical protein B0H10DRAFT_1957646 [Mycena sp. CBHHK59/15]